MAPTTQKLTITYFPMAGRVEAMRLAAAIGKLAYSHKTIKMEEWPSLKEEIGLKNPLGQMPFLEVVEEDGKEPQIIAQSDAILRYFGKRSGLYPDDPVEAAKVDAYLDTVEEAILPIAMSIMKGCRWCLTDEPWGDEETMAIRKRMVENDKFGLQFYFSYFEKRLEEANGNTGWLVGDGVTVADLKLQGFVDMIKSGFLEGIPADIVDKDKYPRLNEHHAKVEAIPEVAAFRAKYSAPYPDYDYEP